MDVTDMHAAVAATLRASIRNTVAALAPAPFGGKPTPNALTALERHLVALLEQERLLCTSYASVKEPEAPWYPDDSGEWVELNGQHPHLAPDTQVEVLLLKERARKTFRSSPNRAAEFAWSKNCGFAAYKVVK